MSAVVVPASSASDAVRGDSKDGPGRCVAGCIELASAAEGPGIARGARSCGAVVRCFISGFESKLVQTGETSVRPRGQGEGEGKGRFARTHQS